MDTRNGDRLQQMSLDFLPERRCEKATVSDSESFRKLHEQRISFVDSEGRAL